MLTQNPTARLEVSETIDCNATEFILQKRWKLLRKLGAGSFGTVYLAWDSTNRYYCAVKLEAVTSHQPQLPHEHKVYRMIGSAVGFPTVIWFGIDDAHPTYNAMVMTLLGPSLDNLFEYCGKKFTLKTVLMLADQIIERLAFLHSKDIIHRDIKPDNFLLGIDKQFTIVHMCDFGLSKQFMLPLPKKQHIPFRKDKRLTGTARYASINAHIGFEMSCRDDIEAIAYMFIYFLKGGLPWQGLQHGSKSKKRDLIYEKKKKTSVDKLCKDLPVEFQKHVNYARGLKFEESPNYKMLQDMYKALFQKMGYIYDNVYDWIIERDKRRSMLAAQNHEVGQLNGVHKCN